MSILFLSGSVLIPNNKFLFIWSSMYLLVQFIITKSFYKTLLICFVPLSLINVGQLYSFEVVPKSDIGTKISDYANGRELFFSFSPYVVLLYTSIAGVIITFFNKKINLFSSKLIVILLLIVLSASFSSIGSSYLQSLSLFYVMSRFGFICLIWLLKSYYESQTQEKKEVLLNLFLQQVMITGVFHSFIVFNQVLSRSTLGLTIEERNLVPVFGLGSDENPFQFRPVGLFSHANILANHLLVLFLSAFSLNIFILKKNLFHNRFFLFFSISIISAIVFTLSRATYVSLGLFLFYIAFLNKEKSRSILTKTILFFKKNRGLFYLLLLILVFTVFDRSLYTIRSFGDSGGFNVRVDLMEISFALIKKNILLGVGSGMFIPAAYYLDSSGVISYFPEAVHNGFLLLFVERGIIGMILIITLIVAVFRSIFSSNYSVYNRKILAMCFISLMLIMLFHPFINIITLYTLILILIL